MSHRPSVSDPTNSTTEESDAPEGAPNAAVADIPPDLVSGGQATARAVEAAIATAPAASQAMPEAGLDEGEEAAAEAVATAGPTASAQHAALDRSLMRGIAWTGGVKLVAQGVGWASTLVVARLLTPRDYGLVGMGTLYMGLVTLLGEFGIGTSVVTLRRLTREQISQINSLSVMFGLAGFLVSCLAAYPLAWFFNEPLLPPVILALAGAFVITSFRTVPYALLQRDLRFKRLAALEGTQAVILACASMFFAWTGFHYWTLVISSLLGAAFSTGAVLYLHRHAFARPRRSTLAEVIAFSRTIIVGRLSFYWFSNADYLVAGKLLGNAAFGAYQVAYNLSMTLLEKTSGLVLRVTPAIFSSVQDDKPAIRRYWLGITEGTALVTFPITIGMSLVTRDFVTVILGPKWYVMISALQILSLYAGFRSILPLTSQLLVATRKGAKVDARNAFQVAIAMPLGFWVGSHWGVTGIAAAWAIVHPAFGLRLLYFGIKRAESTVGQYLQALRPALTGAAVMAVAVVATRLLMPDSWNGIVRLVLEILAGAVAYCATVATLHWDRLMAFGQLWSAMRKR